MVCTSAPVFRLVPLDTHPEPGTGSSNAAVTKSESKVEVMVQGDSRWPEKKRRYRKVPKFPDARKRTPENFSVIYLLFKQRGQTLGYFVKKMLME